jgi:peptidoglycan/LPS O-acetylase OafA/YrhL
MSARERQISPPKQRYDNIDLLRAMAILPVLLFHYTTRFPLEFYKASSVPFHMEWGKFGVDLFFVVSGYCIFLTLDSSTSLSNFWAKRLARLQPAYMLAIALTFLVVATFGLPGRQEGVFVAFANVFWLNAIPTIPHLDGVYWSLIVELKFYFFIGIIYWGASGKNVSFWWAIFCGFGAIAHRVWPLVGEWIFIAPYAPAFLVGLLAYESPKLSKKAVAALGFYSAASIGFSPRFTGDSWTGVGVAVFAYFVLRLPSLKVPKPITYIGLVSYSLYLVHDNIGLVLIRALDPVDMRIRIGITVVTMIAVAAVMNRTIEIRWQKPLAGIFQAAIDGAWGKLPRPKHYRAAGELRRW